MDYTFYIGHPEQFLCKDASVQLQQPEWQARPVVLVVDEAHCVLTWGTYFRPKYQDICHLHALLPKAQILALTATASPRMQEELVAGLHMHHPDIISASIDRPNIFIQVFKRPSSTGGSSSVQQSYDALLDPIINGLKIQQQLYPKTVVYSKLHWCGYGHERAVRVERDGSPSLAAGLVAQFHKPCTTEVGIQLKSCMVFILPSPDNVNCIITGFTVLILKHMSEYTYHHFPNPSPDPIPALASTPPHCEK